MVPFPFCDTCAADLPSLPTRGILYHTPVICCSGACFARLHQVWAPTILPRWRELPLLYGALALAILALAL